jgi:hypothetical protein
MTLWIFSNVDYGFGDDICRSAVDYCRQHRIPCRVVFSPRHDLKRYSGLLRWRYRVSNFFHERLIWSRAPFPWEVVSDVNSERFVSRVQPGDYGLVAGFSQIFGAHLLRRFQDILNVHPSLLPYYRGPVPTRWCLANREEQTGYSIHRMTERIDEGEILFQEVMPIPPGTTEEAVDRDLSRLAARKLPPLLVLWLNGQGLPRQVVKADSIYKVPQSYAGFSSRP